MRVLSSDALPDCLPTLAAAGARHSVLACADGRVLAWGSNANGELGTGTAASSRLPAPVLGFSRRARPGRCAQVSGLSAGDHHTLPVQGCGQLWAWGPDNLGQLGDGTTTGRPAPVRIARPGHSTAEGGFHSLVAFSVPGRQRPLRDGLERRWPARRPAPRQTARCPCR